MRVLVTAGGTREPIDDVRVIANSSTGRLGARVADAFAAAGHRVVLLHGRDAALPERPVERHVFSSSADLADLLTAHVPGADCVVHAAAVSDFVPERTEGKISSDREEVVLRLRRAPKLIDGLRAANGAALLVGFKLTSGKDEAERVAIAGALLGRADLDLVVVNDAGRVGEADHEALLVDGSGVVDRAVGKAAIAASLVSAVEARRPGGVAAP